MRRMYSEQELSKIIKEVFDAEVASGEFDETIAEYVDAYLVEHPVDITALEGQDVELNSLDADGLITGAEIIEKMSGYSFTKATSDEHTTFDYKYAGVVKNGNKITFVIAVEVVKTDNAEVAIGTFNIPESVGSKLFPVFESSVLEYGNKEFLAEDFTTQSIPAYWAKNNNYSIYAAVKTNNLTAEKAYYVRMEITFLLSDNLASE